MSSIVKTVLEAVVETIKKQLQEKPITSSYQLGQLKVTADNYYKTGQLDELEYSNLLDKIGQVLLDLKRLYEEE